MAFLNLFRLPKVSINLMLEKTALNDPFYATVVQRFYRIATARHPKLFFAKQYEYGYALCRLPESFEEYYKGLKKSARWNYRKATRLGYEVRRFDVNTKLDDVAEIWRSAPVRQGRMPKDIREGRVSRVNDPPSRSPFHDYFYVGVFKKDKLLAYASVAIMGELCNLNDLYGHVAYEQDGLVAMLLIHIAEDIFKSYPSVKFYAYGTYFGARAPMRRFKRKFTFYPYRVTWILQSPSQDVPKSIWIYKRVLLREQPNSPLATGSFLIATRTKGLAKLYPLWRANKSWLESLRCVLKVLTGKRIYFGVAWGQRIIQEGWANIGFCRHYSVEPEAVVFGPLWTDPEFRGKGLAPNMIRRVMNILFRRSYRHFYIDTHSTNPAAQKMILKAGFTQRVD